MKESSRVIAPSNHPHAARIALYLVLIASLASPAFPLHATPAAAQERCRRIGSFDVCGRFLDEWSRQGSNQAGLKEFGFPLSERFDEISPTDGKTYMVQYFERNRFELHPEKPAPYDVLLGLLGAQQYSQQAVPADALPIAPPRGVTSARDTLVVATPQEPGSLFNMEEGTTTSERHVWPITFLDALVGMDDKGEDFPLAA